MGQQIEQSHYSDQDVAEFLRNRGKETGGLRQWFRNKVFESEQKSSIGLELETWLVDRDFQPWPKNKEFLERMSDPMVVPELSKYNAEVNAQPSDVEAGCLFTVAECLEQTWSRIQSTMQSMGGHMLMIGILPTLRDRMLSLDFLTDMGRYRALNEQVFLLRKGKAIELKIEGKDCMESLHKDIMLEAATTSFQVHIKPQFDRLNETFNAAIIASSASVALAANSPFLFGADLWDETRSPLFEQAVRLPGYAWLDGTRQERVTFGHDYVRDSVFELFLDNLDGFPALLPSVSNEEPEWLNHVRLQNGTIWRWNRPVIGINSNGQAHLRVEHRVMGAGPTVDDMVANLAFVLGLCHDLAYAEKPPQVLMSFPEARDNFYRAAKDGLRSEVVWAGRNYRMRDLLLEILLPRAAKGLLAQGISQDEVNYYIDTILVPRVQNGQTGAQWQRAWVKEYGADFKGLTEAYFRAQETQAPVHTWVLS